MYMKKLHSHAQHNIFLSCNLHKDFIVVCMRVFLFPLSISFNLFSTLLYYPLIVKQEKLALIIIQQKT